MDKLSAAVDAELVIEFCSITGADSDTAIALLEHNRNNLQLALDSFFRQPCDAEPEFDYDDKEAFYQYTPAVTTPLTLPELELFVEGWKQEAANRLTEGSRNQPCVTQDYNANDPKLKAFWDRIFKQFALKQRLTVLSLVCSDWAQRVRLMPAEVVVSVPDGDIDILRQLQYWLLDYGYLVTGMDVKAEPHVWTSEQLGSGRAGEDARPVLKLVCSDLIGLQELSVEGLVLRLDTTGIDTGTGAAATAETAAATEDATAAQPDAAGMSTHLGASGAAAAATAVAGAAAPAAENAAAEQLARTSLENAAGSNSSSSSGSGSSGDDDGSSGSLVSLDSVDSYGSSSVQSDAALEPLLPALRALSVRNCSMSLLNFKHLQCLRQLTRLAFSGLTVTKHSVAENALDDAGVAAAVSQLLQQLPNLVEFSLGADINLDTDALAAISTVQKLQRVTLRGANCGNHVLDAVPAQISALLLQGQGQLVAPGALDLSRFEHLTLLELSHVDIEPWVWPELQHLVLDSVGIRLPHPAGMPTAGPARVSAYDYNSPEDEELSAALAEMEQLRHLRLLNIYSGPSTGEGAYAGTRAGRPTLYIKPPLTSMQLSRLQFNAYHLKGALSNSVQLPYLRELHIGGLAPPEFLQISEVLTFCSRLKEVVLSAARDDSTLTYTPAQQTLKLKGREFTDHHAHALATHFTGSNPGPSNLFPALSEIEWSGSVELTDVGLMWLVALKGLQRLEVQGCGISHQVFGARPWCDNSKSRLLLTGGDMLYQGSPAVWQQLWELCEGSRLCRNALDKARRELQQA